MSANNASARYSRTGGILSACRGEEARPLWGRKNSLRYSWRDNVKKGFPAFTVETARLAIVPPQWQTRENGFNFRVPAPSRGRRFYSLVPSPPPGVLPPSTRATPAIPLLECCRAHSFQLWSSASSPRIRWNELALRNRKASLHPPLLSNPSSPHLLSPPPLSLSLSLSFPRARTVAVSLQFFSTFVRAIQWNGTMSCERTRPTVVFTIVYENAQHVLEHLSRLNYSTGSNDPISRREQPRFQYRFRRGASIRAVITIPIVINTA